jgi:hypothetical protein
MFTGTTTVALALLPEVESVTPLELEPFLLEWAKPWWEKAGVSKKIDARIGDGQESLKQLAKEGRSFDIASGSLVSSLTLLNESRSSLTRTKVVTQPTTILSWITSCSIRKVSQFSFP